MNKQELRREIRRCKKATPSTDLLRQSKFVCQHIISTDWWQNSQVVLLYSALPDEVDVQMLIDDAVGKGKLVLLPVVVGDVLHLHPYDGETTVGAYGISEPVVKGSRFTNYNKIDVAIIPGMAFDGQCHRLGRGKGYYDRLLSECKDVKKVGVCFSFQYLEEIPTEEHDILMDIVMYGENF